jgi:hypothetical protein
MVVGRALTSITHGRVSSSAGDKGAGAREPLQHRESGERFREAWNDSTNQV